MGQITDLIKESYDNAAAKGFHPEGQCSECKRTTDATFGDRIALIHSELSEALEEYRDGYAFDAVYDSKGQPWTETTPVTLKPQGIPIELADAFIRIADLAGKHGIDLEKAVLLKMAYNKTRPWRHGKKAL